MATSSLVQASGPTGSWEKQFGNTPRRLTSPYVGLSPAMPQASAGPRIEPPVSLPIVAGAKPAAIAAPDPDEEPSGWWGVFHGFCAGGNSTSQEGPPCANSQVAVLPSRIPRAPRNFAATTASSAGMWSASSLDSPGGPDAHSLDNVLETVRCAVQR